MFKILEYYGRFEGFRGRVGRLPGWSRVLLFIAALPGAVLIGLSIAALVVSIAALLVLTVPAYRVMTWVAGSGRPEVVRGEEVVVEEASAAPVDSGRRRQIDVTIIE